MLVVVVVAVGVVVVVVIVVVIVVVVEQTRGKKHLPVEILCHRWSIGNARGIFYSFCSFTVTFLSETNKYAAKRQPCDGFRKEGYKSACEVEAHLLGESMMGARGLLRAAANFLIRFEFGRSHGIHLLFYHSNNPLFTAAPLLNAGP